MSDEDSQHYITPDDSAGGLAMLAVFASCALIVAPGIAVLSTDDRSYWMVALVLVGAIALMGAIGVTLRHYLAEPPEGTEPPRAPGLSSGH
jgi:UDP-N-acetylmuramyl pentapeptide phosphotransferase/UDP-N-acetylglucosamine-1-phosphate transferase